MKLSENYSLRNELKKYGAYKVLSSKEKKEALTKIIEKGKGTPIHCDICFEVIPITKVIIDHCHLSKKIRGCLCMPCNLLLGLAQDSQEILISARQYLELYQD